MGSIMFTQQSFDWLFSLFWIRIGDPLPISHDPYGILRLLTFRLEAFKVDLLLAPETIEQVLHPGPDQEQDRVDN